MLNLDYLVVSETWLSSDESNNLVINKLKNWRIIKRLDATDNVKHMGLLLMSPYTTDRDTEILYALDYVEGYKSNSKKLLYQGLVMDIKCYYKRIIFLYIRETPSSEEATSITNRFKSFDCIIGDLNLNPLVVQDKQKLMNICGKTKQLLLEETTTVNKTQLDHIVIENDMKKNSFATSYHNFASYHKSIALRITSRNNHFTSWFKQKVSFDADGHMKTRNQNPDKIATQTMEETSPTFERLKILSFSNPPRSNLCFSNAVVSMLLNIPIINNMLKSNFETEKLKSKHNEITKELITLNNKQHLSHQSTQRIRTIVKTKCFKSGQLTRDFNNKLQHDAGEFMTSIFEHMFKETILPLDFDETIFGGLIQESIICKCGKLKVLPVQKLSEIWTVQIKGKNMQSCLENFLSSEEIDFECTECGDKRTRKEYKVVIEPNTLLIQLKRFEFDSVQTKILKKHDSVMCPKMITLHSGSNYSLCSILNHDGSTPNSGHYTVNLYDKKHDSFILVDDKNVTYNVVNEDMCKLSYIACYTKN